MTGKICVNGREYKLTLRRDPARDTDPKYEVPAGAAAVLPGKSSLLQTLPKDAPAVLDQGQLGSCQSNSMSEALTFIQLKEGKPRTVFSRLYLYANVRIHMNVPLTEDSGSSIRDICLSVNETRACSESLWPYDINRFTDKPPQQAYTAAAKYTQYAYSAVKQNLDTMKHCIAVTKVPIIIGFSVYQSFETPDVAATGIMPMPDDSEECLGGHAVLIVGYDDDSQTFLVQNSWGPGWGDNGYFHMPYEYALNPDLAFDFWAVTKFQ